MPSDRPYSEVVRDDIIERQDQRIVQLEACVRRPEDVVGRLAVESLVNEGFAIYPADRIVSVQDVELGFLREMEASMKRGDAEGEALAKWALAVMRRLWPEQLVK